MFRTLMISGALFAAMAVPALADPIEGKWKTQSGETAQISTCGGGYCVKLTTGKHAGKQIGKLAGAGGKYSGKITDPVNDKTYSGDASISGNSMKMRGCVARILCRTQNWSRL